MNKQPKVVRRKRREPLPLNTVYVGRPSVFGNPFPITDKQDRATAIQRFRNMLTNSGYEWQYYADEREKILSRLHELRGKDLACWCAPLPCHADVLLELANMEAESCQS